MSAEPHARDREARPARGRRLVLAVAAIAVLVFGGHGAWLALKDRGAEAWVTNRILGLGGPFDLTRADGGAIGRDDLLGHPHIVYFGFTLCPDLCPTTLFQLATIMGEMGADADRLLVLFVSVDPEHDTPEVLAEYISAFDPRMIAATGTPDEIARAAKAYRIVYRKVDLGDGTYTYDHSASALLFDADGDYAGAIAHDESMERAREKVRGIVEG